MAIEVKLNIRSKFRSLTILTIGGWKLVVNKAVTLFLINFIKIKINNSFILY